MVRTFLIPLLAIAGVIFGVFTVVKGSKPPVAAMPVAEPPKAPFDAFVAGSGLIESSSQNIAVGNPVAGVVTSVKVVVGDRVKTGDVLFELDARDLAAQLVVRQAEVETARAQLQRLEAQPRPEEIPPAEARVALAAALVADAKDQLAMWEQVTDKRAISADEMSRRRYAVQAAETRQAEAAAQLKLLVSGAWSSDLSVAKAQLAGSEAAVEAITIEQERRIVRCPVDGQVLQVNVRVGEFAPAGAMSVPLMMVGSVSPLHVRTDVDEHEAYRVAAGAKAMGYLRGNKDISTPLTFVRFEPYVVPKKSLTGDSTERVDTRVLQVLYSFERRNLPVYVGQQMDVYIEAAPTATAQTPAVDAGKH